MESFFNVGNHFLEEEIFVVPVALGTVEIAFLSGIAIRHDDDHGGAFALLDSLICNIFQNGGNNFTVKAKERKTKEFSRPV